MLCYDKSAVCYYGLGALVEGFPVFLNNEELRARDENLDWTGLDWGREIFGMSLVLSMSLVSFCIA
jgi:hypothetical protein